MFRLNLPGGSNIDWAEYVGYTNTQLQTSPATVGFEYLHAPATTSAITYKTQFKNAVSSGTVIVQNGNATVSTITLMEIGA
jgi:hypothetical protein